MLVAFLISSALVLSLAPAAIAAGPPELGGEWSSSVAYTEATLNAEINPNGSATTYEFEWGPTAAYGNSTAQSGVGSDEADHEVGAFLEGLQQGTTYHYRVVATNSEGTSTGADHTFTTYVRPVQDFDCPNQVFRTGPAALLPNCRAYEMVSPVDKKGGDVSMSSADIATATGGFAMEWFSQSDIAGKKVAYHSYTAFGDAVSSPIAGTVYIATRGDSGWSSRAVSPPRTGSVFSPGGTIGIGYKLFSPDLSGGWLTHDSTPLTSEAPVGFANLYRWDSSDGYEPLVKALSNAGSEFRPVLEGVTPDQQHVVFAAQGTLIPGVPTPAEVSQLYDLSGGELHLISIMPDGQASPQPSHAGTPHGIDGNGFNSTVTNAVSDDGSHIFWSAGGDFSPGRIFVRINNQTTVPVSESVSAEPARFWDASSDGSRVFFTISTPGAGEKEDLYEFTVASETATLIAGESPGVVAASDDGSYLYFVSEESLDAGATVGERNLYVRHDGDITFIGTLSKLETSAAGRIPSVIGPDMFKKTIRLTPDGKHLVFGSERSLTGYDNTDADSGEPDSEIFLYDAETDGLTCISCNPSGARPTGGRLISNFSGKPASPTAAAMPAWETQVYAPNALMADGDRLFFNSLDALLPQDTNGKEDVYQWERQGTGSCQSVGGCLSLISTGESAADSDFLDATPDGDTVYIATRSSIAPQDPGLMDVYAVSVGGGYPPPPHVESCIGDACQSPPEAPRDATPASASFHGAGDPTPRKARRRACKRKRSGAKHGHQTKKKNKRVKRCAKSKRRAGR